VDTLGLVLGVAVTPASTPERDGAQTALRHVLGWFTWLRPLWVDGCYTGDAFAQWVKELRPKLVVKVVKRSDDTSGFKVVPRRWMVERTFGCSCATVGWFGTTKTPKPAPKPGSLSP
jgi:transposase